MKMKIYYRNLLLVVVLAVSCTPSPRFLKKNSIKNQASIDYVRVLIYTTKSRITISSKDRLKVVSQRTRKILYDSKNKSLVFYPERIKDVMVIESWKQPLMLNNSPYRGRFELHNIMGKMYVINILTIEEYLYSVVPSEIPSSWPKESLKAQAVAARTYTYYHLFRNKKRRVYDLDATTNFQVYKGASAETSQTTQAVRETSGEIIQYRYQPILAYFHSTCGGKVIDDKYVWGKSDFPYLKSKRCHYCNESPYYSWTAKLNLYAIKSSLSKKYKGVGQIRRIQFKKRGGRVFSVTIHHSNGIITLSGNNFRLLFPPKTLKSMFYHSKKVKGGLVISGHGWGHGVGLCQYGAKGLAQKGVHYRKILRYYYSNTTISKYRHYKSQRSIADNFNKNEKRKKISTQ